MFVLLCAKIISADDMGLGKTLTMISLVLKTREESENKDIAEKDPDDEEDEEGETSCLRNWKCKFSLSLPNN